jgi:hypothetical protein
MISHSPIGLVALLVASLLILYPFGGKSILFILAAFVSATSHLAVDAFIGHIYPLFPLSDTTLELHQFNTLFDLQTELLLNVAAILLFLILLHPWRGLTLKSMDQRGKFLLVLLAVPFFVISVGELILYSLSDIYFNAPLSAWLLIPFFLMPLLISGFISITIMIRWLRRPSSN